MGILTSVNPWDDNTYGNGVKTLRVLVECEKGSYHKYEYDDKLDKMVIVRDLDPKYRYIYNYGCIPQTLAGDEDCLDAIVLSEETIRSGTLINVRPIMVIRMIDNGQQDDKIICVPYYVGQGSVDLKKLVAYLQNYKYPRNEGTEIVGIGETAEALEIINAAIKRFRGTK